jgi:hypothetical protein
MEYDWAHWSSLAARDPEAFERERRATLDAFIAGAPPEHQARLKGLQFRIDLERQRSATPLGASIRLNRLMWDSFTELRSALAKLREASPARPAAVVQTAAPRVAAVLRFPGERRS